MEVGVFLFEKLPTSNIKTNPNLQKLPTPNTQHQTSKQIQTWEHQTSKLYTLKIKLRIGKLKIRTFI